jgi:hypothetical protein
MQQITKDSIVEQVLTNFPKTLEVFISHGFKDLSNPIMRNTMAKFVTIGRACKMKAVDQDAFLLELNKTINSSTH